MAEKYIHEEATHNLSAPKIIVPFLAERFKPVSVIDIGCGTGTFLKVFIDEGVQNVTGIDGEWVAKAELFVDKNLIITADLEKEIQMPGKYDLVLSLEVAEHISSQNADTFIKNLISLGDVIIFSAAAKNQGGQNHINEQDVDYWIEKFAKHNFVFHDVFRDFFWDNKQVDWWYRQNMYLITRRDIDITRFGFTPSDKKIRQHIHPEALKFHVNSKQVTKAKLNKIVSGKSSLRLYVNLLGKKISNKIAGR